MNIRNSRPIHAPAGSKIKQLGAGLQNWMRLRVFPAGRALLEQVANGLADSREQEDLTAVTTEDLLKNVVFWTLARVQQVRKRWRNAGNWPRSLCIGGAAFLGALLLTFSLRPMLRNETAQIFLCAVMVSATMGGLYAGLFTTLLVVLPCIHILLHAPGPHTAFLAGEIKIGLFTLLALVACALSDSLYLARQQAETARRQAETLTRRSQFLAQASAFLNSSHDSVTLSLQVARAIVPAFAEGAIVDLIDLDDSHQTLRRVAAMHHDPEKEALLHDLNFRFPVETQANHPVANALRTGQAELIEQVEAKWLAAINPDADYLDLARRLGTRSLLCAPLVARNRTFGVLTLISTSPERRYTQTDLVVAKDLALRMALALDNLRLYREAQEEIRERARMEQQIRDYSRHLEEQRLQLQEANIRLSMQVSTDGLTGLNNHLAFQETLAKEVQRAVRYQSPLSLLLLDVDKFKQYNDTYGHPAGDQVLRKVANVLKTNARDTDFVARYGGEEFAVILPNTAQTEALEVAERLRGAIEATRGLERVVTASFGAATLSERLVAAPELISWTDKALYASKHGGRNRVTHAEQLLAEGMGVPIVQEAVVVQEVAVEAVVSVRNSTERMSADSA